MAYYDGPKKDKIIRLPSKYIIPTNSYNVSGWDSYRYLAEEAEVDVSCLMLPVKMLVAMYAYVSYRTMSVKQCINAVYEAVPETAM